MKHSGEADEYDVIREDDAGFGWMAFPGEAMRRASHAFATDDGVYVVDPVDVPDLDEHLEALGDVAGVVLTLDRHERDSAAVAERHDVPVFVPEFFGRTDLGVETKPLRGSLARFAVIPVVNRSFWNEIALWDADSGELWVSEVLGTSSYFVTGENDLGVHPMVRGFPPRKQLGDLTPSAIYTGHGRGVSTGATAALQQALADSRRRMPQAYAGIVKNMLFG